MRSLLMSASLAIVMGGCSTAEPGSESPPGHQTGEEAAVLAVMDRYMHAISANDLQAMAAVQTADGMRPPAALWI